jgi:hypothetical protein
MRRLSTGAMAALALVGAACASARPPADLDTRRIAVAHFGNDAPWYRDRIPFFASDDPQIDAVYYYRWALFRAHQRDLGAEGYISTEFLDDVPWQREPYASLNDATGFHLGEGRWLRDRRYVADYVDYMFRGGNDRHFSDYMADSVYGLYLVDGDRTAALRHLGVMRYIYGLWDDRFDWTKGLYWIEPLLDATEYTVSSIDASGGNDGFRGGEAFRPSINSYMVANARALARLAALAGDARMAAEFVARADALRTRILRDLWSPALTDFVDRYQVDNAHVHYWSPIRARELVGYVPWAFDIPPDDPALAAAWSHLMAPDGFAGKAGLRTVEPGYPNYMRQYRYLGTAPECQWNGPVWPYQTTQALIAMANLLDHYHQSVVTRGDYLRLLRQYAALHFLHGKLDLQEDYDPETGLPIVGLDRSHHYFHSGFVDLVLTGLVGLRPRADNVLEVNPLLPSPSEPGAIRWFRVQDVAYHGHSVAVSWDQDGRHFGRGRGLSIEVDGREVARTPTLSRLTVPLSPAPAADFTRPLDRAVQLQRGAFPRGSASTNPDAEQLHDAIDGRIWFFSEQPNGWSSAPLPAQQWYEVDLGKNLSLSRAEIAFFADGRHYAVPRRYRIQVLAPDGWRDVGGEAMAPVANGITHARWPAVTGRKFRLLMGLAKERQVRLVEFKLF